MKLEKSGITLTIPWWLFAILLTAFVLSILYACGVFKSEDIKQTQREADDIGLQIDTTTTKRDSALQSVSETSKETVDETDAIIKNQMPNEKYTAPRDTTDDYMFSKITEPIK